MFLNKPVLLVAFICILVSVKSEDVKKEVQPDTVLSKISRQGREYYHHYPPEEDKKPEYPSLTYPPSSYYPIRDGPAECPPNPLMPILGNGLNFLLLKLGAIGIIKAIFALLFLGFLVKLPILLVKLAFLKSFFLPVLIAPLLMNMFSSNMMQPMRPMTDDKPSETPQTNEGSGRDMDDVLSSNAWQSMRMIMTSDKCVERIACEIGSYSNNSTMGSTFNRMLKFLQISSPVNMQEKAGSIREAFKEGYRNGYCAAEEYECQSPQLMLQHGSNKFRVL